MSDPGRAEEERARFHDCARQAIEAYKSKQRQQSKALWHEALMGAHENVDLALDLFNESIAFGNMQERYGDFDESQANYALALQFCHQRKLPLGLRALAQSRLAVNAVNRGVTASAAEMFDTAIATFESDAERNVLAYAECLNHYGHHLRETRQWVAAIDAYEKAYKCYQQISGLPENDLMQRRLSLRNSLKSTAEQSDDALRDKLRARVHAVLPSKGSPEFP